MAFLQRARIPLSEAFYLNANRLEAGRHVVLEVLPADRAAGSGRVYKHNLLDKYVVVDQPTIRALNRILEGQSLLVGELERSFKGRDLEEFKTEIADIKAHMRERKQLLERKGITVTPDAKYPILNDPNLVEKIIHDSYNSDTSQPKDRLEVILALDCSESMSTEGRLRAAKETARELMHQLKFYYKKDEIKIVAYSDGVREITDLTSFDIGAKRGTNTAGCLAHCHSIANPRRRTHIYLVTDGEANNVEDAVLEAAHIKTAKIDFTQIVIGSEYASGAEDFRRVSEAAGGNLLRIKGDHNNDILHLAVAEDYKRYRARRAA